MPVSAFMHEKKIKKIRLQALRNTRRRSVGEIDEDDVKTVAMLMWAEGKHGGVKSELCSLLNRALRDGEPRA